MRLVNNYNYEIRIFMVWVKAIMMMKFDCVKGLDY